MNEIDHKDRVVATITEFQKRRRKQLIVLFPAIAAVVLAMAVRRTDLLDRLGLPLEGVAPVILAVFGGLIVYSLYNWRCPNCNKYLGRDLSPRFCNKCGAQLRL